MKGKVKQHHPLRPAHDARQQTISSASITTVITILIGARFQP